MFITTGSVGKAGPQRTAPDGLPVIEASSLSGKTAPFPRNLLSQCGKHKHHVSQAHGPFFQFKIY
jgi:hypothetical protein